MKKWANKHIPLKKIEGRKEKRTGPPPSLEDKKGRHKFWLFFKGHIKKKNAAPPLTIMAYFYLEHIFHFRTKVYMATIANWVSAWQ
jgi:hypothetical protein